MKGMTYHHGNLRAELLAAAATAVASRGPDGLSLRELARGLGVTHTAPRHHFGDKRGLLTALAAQGYTELSDRLTEAGDDFLEAGVAYVRFALENPGHFAVMFRPDLVENDDEALIEARTRARQALVAGAGAHAVQTGRVYSQTEDTTLPPYALLAWSSAHGIANLALAGALGAMGMGASREALVSLARESLQHLKPM